MLVVWALKTKVESRTQEMRRQEEMRLDLRCIFVSMFLQMKKSGHQHHKISFFLGK